MRRALIVLVLAGLAIAGVAQAQPDVSALNPTQLQGRKLFDATCAYCHRTAGFAAEALARRLGKQRAELEARSDLQSDYVRYVVKHGLGNMPAYTPTDLTASQLDAVIAYLTRNNPPAAAH